MAATAARTTLQVMPDDHSELVPPLPIPNRTVKRLCADDSAATSVKVGHRQAVIPKIPKLDGLGIFFCLVSFDPLFCRQPGNAGSLDRLPLPQNASSWRKKTDPACA